MVGLIIITPNAENPILVYYVKNKYICSFPKQYSDCKSNYLITNKKIKAFYLTNVEIYTPILHKKLTKWLFFKVFLKSVGIYHLGFSILIGIY